MHLEHIDTEYISLDMYSHMMTASVKPSVCKQEPDVPVHVQVWSAVAYCPCQIWLQPHGPAHMFSHATSLYELKCP